MFFFLNVQLFTNNIIAPEISFIIFQAVKSTIYEGNYEGNFQKDWNKFSEIFLRKFLDSQP